MDFKTFSKMINDHFNKMCAGTDMLYVVDIDKDVMWNHYLDSFPDGTNEVYRKRREHDCSCCKHFIRAFGNVVVIKNQVVHTIWEITGAPYPYQDVANAMDAMVRSANVAGVFTTHEHVIGTQRSYETRDDGSVTCLDHFYVSIPNKFVQPRRVSLGEMNGQYAASKQVFKRSLDEISVDAVDTVLELISQKSLYKGEEWGKVLRNFRMYQNEYMGIPDDKKDLYAWEKFDAAGVVIARIRNHSIGVLLVDISNGVELDEAVRRYEAIVAPTNYKRPKAIFTKRMLEDARRTVEEMGYTKSLDRRFATLDDITINNILFCNRDAAGRIAGGDAFDDMMADLPVSPKKFSRVDEISIEDFVSHVLPTAQEVDVLVENRHSGNMVSLIAPKNPDSKSMFKWGNAFGWSYVGNITDSIKEHVKAAGGRVDGVLRFSIQWNDDTGENLSDLDAHCKEPGGEEIAYYHKVSSKTRGNLDVDIIHPTPNVAAVENITWASTTRMEEGEYKFFVHCYNHRRSVAGFKAEIEFNGNVYSFEHAKALRQDEIVNVATVFYSKKDGFSIKTSMPASASCKEIWGVKSNQFVPVSVVMYSPNYWDNQDGVGHRHYFFMLKGCKNPDVPNGWYNEFLKEELMKHKRVFEALGSKMHVEDADDQLSGLGFSATKHDELIVKVKGATERVMKVKF